MVDFIAGKISIITGGAGGIGAAYVKELFKHGMKACTISDIDESGEAVAEEIKCCYGKGKAIFVKADITDKSAFEKVFKTNMNTFNGLDLVVNNAGVLRDHEWDHMIDLNIKSTVYGSLLGIRYMGKNNGGIGGTIVNTASIFGLQGLSGCPVYTGTQHFVIGFTRSTGTPFWYNLTGCRFLTICPGVTSTPMIYNAEQCVLEGFPGLGKSLARHFGSTTSQTVEHLAEGLSTMLNEGDNGSIWVGEEEKRIYQIVISDRKKFKKDGTKC